MFVRTPRLTLRPAWPEDAAELAHAIGHECVVRNLGRAPWPYPIEAAESYAATFRDSSEPKFLVFAHQKDSVQLVGAAAVELLKDSHEFGYWLTPAAWGRGYATEAGRAVLQAARARGIRRVSAGHYIDNPASGRVLRKLGFKPTGHVTPLYSRGRGAAAPCARFAIDLAEGECGGVDPENRMAA